MADNRTSRRFVLTVNNYDDGDIESFRNFVHGTGRKFACYQRERGATGTDHLQGYVVFQSPTRRSVVAEIWPRAHIEVARGKEEQCIAYCSKVDDTTVPGTFEEFGTRSDRQGKRTDIDAFVVAIRDGKSGKELFEEFPQEYLRYNGGHNVARMYAPRRNFKTEIWWLWGSTGTGKSKWANWKFPDAYWKSPVTKWWDGYDPRIHSAVIVDDYRRDFCQFAELLRLFDRYAYSVEIKGSTLEFSARTVVITTQYPPELTWWGQEEEKIGQLSRRIDHCVYFGKRGEESESEEVYAGEENGIHAASLEELTYRGFIENRLRDRDNERKSAPNPFAPKGIYKH